MARGGWCWYPSQKGVITFTCTRPPHTETGRNLGGGLTRVRVFYQQTQYPFGSGCTRFTSHYPSSQKDYLDKRGERWCAVDPRWRDVRSRCWLWSQQGRSPSGTTSKCRFRLDRSTRPLVISITVVGVERSQMIRFTARRVAQCCNAQDDDVRNSVVGGNLLLG